MTYARLDVTDRVDLPGARLAQRGELLELDLADGSRVTLAPSITDAIVLRITGRESRVAIGLAPEVAVRVGSHLAALGAQSLEPAEGDGLGLEMAEANR